MAKSIFIKLLLLTLMLIVSIVTAADTSKDSDQKEGELFHQDFSLSKGEKKNIKIYMSTIFSKKPDISVHKNVIAIEVQNEVVSQGDSLLPHLIDVEAQMISSSGASEAVDIKDIIVEGQDKNIILHYIVYDLCNIDKNSYVSLNIEAIDGKFQGFVGALVTDLEAFSIKCTDKESDTFLPREQHGACDSFDSKVWVFGGKRNIKKDEQAMNDIMVYDASKNSWKTIIPTSGSKPTPRYGHVMMCYFQYFVIFGGQSQDGTILGDLWVFDTIGEKWIFIMDTRDTHELKHLNIEDKVPKPRSFSSAIMIPEIGAGYITGGQTDHGVACDIWGLKVERVVGFVEDKDKNPMSNFWIQKTVPDQNQAFLCRENHVSALVDKDTFVVWGGLNTKHQFVDQAYSFSVMQNNLQLLQQSGPGPEPRIRCGVLSSGAGMVILYGGSHLQGKGYFIDLWHFIVSNGKIEFRQIDYELEGDNLFMTWRHGFSLHYVRGVQDPVLIGGTYGNNQQSRALVTLPEKKCSSMNDYAAAKCSPCPRGSIYKSGTCVWCDHDQYFRENSRDYFQSECRDCPLGLVGGYYKSCVPCQGGYIYDLSYPSFCRKCTDNEICPMGTRYAFPKNDYSENFQEVRLDNLPDMFNPHKQPFDHTSIIVVFLCVFLTLVLFIVIAMVISMCKERSLFVFREMDIPFITGGGRKRVVGGVIMAFFILIVTIVSIGFFVNYFMFNSKTVLFETKNPYLDRAYPSSYQFKVNLYTSRFLDSTDSRGRHRIDDMAEPLPDLCKMRKIDFSLSRYFQQAEDKNKQFTCTRNQMSQGTDEYVLTLKIFGIKDEAPEHAFIRFQVDSDYEQIYHFFKWEYWNVWRFYETIPISYSKVSGFVTPQMVTKSNKNITAAFRGPESTQLNFRLTPTHYGNEIESQNFEGYQVFLDSMERGSVVNKRNMANSVVENGLPSAGINIEMFSHVSDTLNHVQVQRVKSLLETLAYVLGFTAGFVIIAHLMKYFLAKEEYFKSLDRECDTLFGSLDSERITLNTVINRDSSSGNIEMRRFTTPTKEENGAMDDHKEVE